MHPRLQLRHAEHRPSVLNPVAAMPLHRPRGRGIVSNLHSIRLGHKNLFYWAGLNHHHISLHMLVDHLNDGRFLGVWAAIVHLQYYHHAGQFDHRRQLGRVILGRQPRGMFGVDP